MILLVSAILLSFERIAYVLIWRAPEAFRKLCERSVNGWAPDPVTAVRRLFYVFKAVQVAVFLVWCWYFGNGSLVVVRDSIAPVIVGSMLMLGGQSLNLGVFYRLGGTGVFYGGRFGHEIPWCDEFPFSLLDHPQYVGAVISIWGFFIAIRFPHVDWFLLPALETAYYIIGSWLES